MISKLRIKDRSDTAWNLTKYESVWYGMRDEFEMDDRFDAMEFKLKLIEQNATFFVNALQSQKSNTLEWIIVVLIAVECLIMLGDMTGMGEAVVGTLKGWWFPTTPTSIAAADAIGSGSDVDAAIPASGNSDVPPSVEWK
jgi:hypothetical protein